MLSSIAVFHNPLSRQSALGYAITTLGVGIFTWLKARKAPAVSASRTSPQVGPAKTSSAPRRAALRANVSPLSMLHLLSVAMSTAATDICSGAWPLQRDALPDTQDDLYKPLVGVSVQ